MKFALYIVAWLVVFTLRGREFGMSLKFALEKFAIQPTSEQLDICRKNDLFTIADFYQITVPRGAVKQEIKEVIHKHLMERGVLPERSESAGVAFQLPVFAGEGEQPKPEELASIDPVDLTSPRDPLLAIRLKELEVELGRQRYESQLLHVRTVELETKRDIKLKELELELKTKSPVHPSAVDALGMNVNLPSPMIASTPSPIPAPRRNPQVSQPEFDISRQISLVPLFRETEVDTYFTVFERIAGTLKWPRNVWPLLLQCKLVGKAQEVCSALTLEQSLDYEVMKNAVLRAYELVPEAYRQKFRNHVKTPSQTYVEFARDKASLFEKWCAANKIVTFEQLKELILLEEFKNCLPEKIVVYLNEQKVSSLSAAAVFSDEFVLTHRVVFSPTKRNFPDCVRSSKDASVVPKNVLRADFTENRECFYCHEVGHLISACPVLKRKAGKKANPSKSVALIERPIFSPEPVSLDIAAESAFKPFIFDGVVSFNEADSETKRVCMLRDTGAAQSFILESVLPFSEHSNCGSSVLVQGIDLTVVKVPLHNVYLRSGIISGNVKLAVRAELPVKGVSLILGNDLAGDKVFCLPEVIDVPDAHNEDALHKEFPDVFSTCVVTRAQAHKFKDSVDLSKTFLCADNSGETEEKVDAVELKMCALPNVDFPFGKTMLIEAQRADQTLCHCVAAVVEPSVLPECPVGYFFEDGVLMRKWSPGHVKDDWGTVVQVVIPKPYREQVLSVAHDHELSGHVGVRKTYDNLLKHFFWPSMKSDVSKFCKSCHACQLSGKPNQVIPPAPLRPIPVLGEPFERILIDCVGPLPKTKSGNSYLLTLMCTSTRYPEAIPLRSLKAHGVVKAIVKFCTTFGVPKYIQSDQGTNFMSKVFTKVIKKLNIKHQVSSAYHPQSQGAIERFHQTLKSMLRTFCVDQQKEWDEEIPLLLFAIRTTTQASLGFSPAELIFGHTVRGPLKILQEQILSSNRPSPTTNVLDYISSFRERLHKVWKLAKRSLDSAQDQMKTRYDQKAVQRSFQIGEKVLVLLPVPGSALKAKFTGPYDIKEKLSVTDYVVDTPNRKKKSRVCHINMLKAYVSRSNSENKIPVVTVAPVNVSPSEYSPEIDGLKMSSAAFSTARLSNSETLLNFATKLSHLSISAQADILDLVKTYPTLFSDSPTTTHVLKHDIDVGSHAPVKQSAYRVNPLKKELMKQETQYLLKHNLAAPSSSPWCSPCLLVPKPDGTSRFCTDYRKVNALTKADSFPLPRMEDCVDRVGNAKFVTKLDLLKGYWQVPLTERASEISAFATPEAFLQYRVMPFGLRNAGATFQRLMSIVLSNISNCEVYLDDVVCHASTWEEHLKILEEVFKCLRDANLTLNLAKCEFGCATVTYLGKEVGSGQICPLSSKIQAVLDFPIPKNRRDLRRFLGMTGYYRCFCKNFSSVAYPLTELLRKAVSFKWTSECQSAFEALKTLLCSSPVLVAPLFEKPFLIEVDASGSGVGAVLLQTGEDFLNHPISFFSKKFLKHQMNYSTIEKEALALILALQHFEVYIGSSVQPVTIFTDHNPLTFLQQMSNSNHRLMRWSLICQSYNMKICHKKGIENVIADSLSRVNQ
ncbi:hypothetical protein PO909_018663 [Leuciscus waleckii]